MNTKTAQFKLTAPTTSILFVCALLIGAMQGTADANVCKKAKARPPCVDSRDVQANSISGISIVDNSLTATDQSDEAGADFAGGSQFFDLTGGYDIVRSVTITAPTAGRVIVNASGSSHFDSSTTLENMACSITTGLVLDTPNISVSEFATNSGLTDIPFGLTRGFVVPAGSTTFNLVCIGTSTMFIHASSLTAIFVPTAY